MDAAHARVTACERTAITALGGISELQAAGIMRGESGPRYNRGSCAQIAV